MHELKDITFIIPLCIESDDRYKNARSVIGYLNHHFTTNIIFHEFHDGNSKLDFLDTLPNLNIVKHIEENNGLSFYHKTKQINQMLEFVQTPITFLHDIDVILPIESYILTNNLLKNTDVEFVRPYGEGYYAKHISTGFDRTIFNKEFDIKYIPDHFIETKRVYFGYCYSIKTDTYKNIGRENENFIQWGPEDLELDIRIEKLKISKIRINADVYHFSHSRTNFSTSDHVYADNNNKLLNYLKSLSEDHIIDYYKNVEYLKKYKR